MSRKSDYRDGDSFTKRSRKEGYRSRSSYKLKEILEKQIKLSKGHSVLDLGSYPGGWSQVAVKLITRGKILSVDIRDMEPIKNVEFFKGDIKEKKTKFAIIEYFKSNLDVIISDIAADTTGNKSLDSIRTNQLCADIINFSKEILKPKGVLVSKLFAGEDFIEVKNLAKTIFKKVNFYKPESSRKESKETYLHCETLKSL